MIHLKIHLKVLKLKFFMFFFIFKPVLPAHFLPLMTVFSIFLLTSYFCRSPSYISLQKTYIN